MSSGGYTYQYAPDLIPDRTEPGEGMWRWRRLLPLDGSSSYPLRVGGTPLLAPARLRAELDLPGLVVKDETRSPTGSNKDRATALCLVDALRRRAPAIVCASTGNVAASLSAGAAAVGIPAYVFVSKHTVSPHKVDLMRSFGATVVLVDGPYEAAYRLSEAACERLGWYSRNTAANPLVPQAKKTVAFEVWAQLGHAMPEVAYVPVGDGVTLAAFVLGCEELVRCGVADRVPRVVGVQASGAAPLVRAFADGRLEWTPVESHTFADGIGVGDPFYGRQALEAVRRTGGEFVDVGDDAIRAAIALLARSCGLLAEPAGAAALAGALAHRGRPAGEACVLVLATGTGLKDHRWLPRGSGLAIEVPPDVAAFLAHPEVAARAGGACS
ncbi:MAG: pyridoxal-phosphate dependent enzyme [Chloroflexi bacterium]|nr:pyridoxal-phosphate dependent enzyme [Chloroflexota bacterium]